MGRILIVDDEAGIRSCMGAALGRQGHEVYLAADATEGYLLAGQHLPDLIISDICMEGMDGFNFLKRIRANPRTSTIPFIFVTGNPDRDGMVQGLEQAADGYLPKPFSLPSFITTVENRLRREELVRRNASEIKTQLFRVFQAAPDLIAIVDPETQTIQFLNAAGKRMLEVRDEPDQPLTSYFLPASAENWRRHAIPAAFHEGKWFGETVLIAPSGRRLPVELLLQSHRRHDEKVEYFSVIARDLSERNESERALRESEYRFRCLVDALPDGVLMYDREANITFCNARAADLLGFAPRELLDLSVSDVFRATEDPDALPSQNRAAEFSATRKDGEALPVSVYREKLLLGTEPLELCIFHDLTDRKRLERERQEVELQLRQAQKLESIGQLAAGIAHEINTPTQYIGDNTRFLKDGFASVLKMLGLYEKLIKCASPGLPPELLKELHKASEELDLSFLIHEIPAAIEQSLEGIERVSKIVRAMKDFSHPNITEKTPIDINHAIESTITVARNEWKYVADLETDLDPSLPPVPCLPGEFNQVVLNLIVNAAHAIGDVVRGSSVKGNIRVITRRLDEWAELRISDSGTGIPKQIQGKIFEPFFTTKQVGKGTGQGLPIARSVIVDKHGGTITFETEDGKGTTFIIRLPLASKT